ncbi:hypothetical protein FACS18942_06340 [Planctomycetales bacterium]|nr:hypothetical protein FACS18942_06340 [Planctomycetales bacterium]
MEYGEAIERRDFFGKSYYQDGDGHFDAGTNKWNYGTQVRNSNGFSKWDYGSGSYTGTPNQNDFAIGAHLFAKNLNILQVADIFADGAGSAGVRIDGQNNQLTVDKNTKIITNGVNGVGVLAAYGSNHNIIHQGYIKASGYGGKGISIDFGLPAIGDVRGSYYQDNLLISSDNQSGILAETNGPLVNNLDITGTVIGDSVRSRATYVQAGDLEGNTWRQTSKDFDLGAAVYIDQTAHLKNLNIMNGAVITGDIISFWTGPQWEVNSANQSGSWTAPNGYPTFIPSDYEYQKSDMQTNLTFGLKAAADGSATNAVDPNFHFVYKGNINYFRYELFPNIVTNWNSADGTYNIPQQAEDRNDTSWRFLTWDDGFFYSADKYFRIERDLAKNKVYAGVATPGMVDLRFAAGTTEFVGSVAYVRNATVDYGATLILTPDPDRKYDITDPGSEGYGQQHNGEPEIHVGTAWNDAEYAGGNEDRLYSPYKDKDPAYNTTDRFMTNNGRIAGDGKFYLGGMTNTFDFAFPTYYSGIFYNNGTLSPGADNGKGVGTIQFFGDLRLNNTSTYEFTLSRLLRTDKDGYPTDENGNHILANGDVIDAKGNIVFDEVYNETTHQFQQIRRKRDPAFVESNDKLLVSGETRLGGTLKVNVTPGSIFNTVRSKYTVIESGVFTSNTHFDKVISDAAFLSFLPDLDFVQQRNSVLAQLTVIRDLEYFTRFASGRTHNQTAVGNALDSSLNYDSYLGFTLGHQDNSAADMLALYDQLGASIRANSIMMNLWNPAEMVFNRIGYGNGQMQTGGRGGINWKRVQERRAKILGQYDTPNRAGSMWGNYFNTSFEAAADGNSAAYNFSRNGFVVGAEMNITPYSALGFNIAYSNNSLHQGADKADSDDYQLGLYLVAAPFNEFELKSYLGMGIQEYDMNRRIQSANFTGNVYNSQTQQWDTFTGINEHYKSKANGNTLNYSLELARPVAIHPAFILRPTLGLDVYYITQGRFNDEEDRNSSNLYRLNYNGTNLDRTLLRAGFSSETSGDRGGLRMRTFYVSNVGGDLYPVSKASFIAGSDPFTIWGTKLGKNYLNLGISGNLYLDGAKTSSFFFDYDADIYNTQRKIYNHSFNLGFVQNF